MSKKGKEEGRQGLFLQTDNFIAEIKIACEAYG